MTDYRPHAVDRRTALKWMLTVAASVPIAKTRLPGGETPPVRAASGYGTDPQLTKTYAAGELWPLTMTGEQRRTATALCDTIIPADEHSPAASKAGVIDFLDEWISAPYPRQRADRLLLLEGLAWLETESLRRFGHDFAALDEARREAICDDLCQEATGRIEYQRPAVCFALFRDLTAAGYYTTPVGMKDIGYIGNMPLATFDGPPEAALRHVGLL